MPAVPQKIRTGLVELRTKSGPVYVGPSLLERIYLLWTFRNFHSLPRQVLNRREQRLIDKLCRTAMVSRRRPNTKDAIIGAVENVELIREPKIEAPLAPRQRPKLSVSKVDKVSSRVAGSDPISVPSKPTAEAGDASFRHKRKLQPLAESRAHCAEPSATKKVTRMQRFTTDIGGWGRWALVGLCGLAVIGIRLHFKKDQTMSRVIAQTATGGYRANSASISDTSGTRHPSAVETGEVQQTSDRRQLNQASTSQTSSPRSVKGKCNSSNSPVRPRAVKEKISHSPEREPVQIVEAPESWSYPVAPDSALTGKVSLKALVGKDGTVSEVDVLSGQRALAQAAMRAVKHWRYHAHEINGNAVEAVTKVDIKFLGDDAVSISYPAE